MPGSPLRPWHLHQARRALLAGGVIAYPTEAVFGLGCLARCTSAIRRLLRLKRRPANKGLILVAANLQQLSDFIAIDDAVDWSAVLATWPGPVTWLLPASPGTPGLLTGDSSLLAVRISAHPVVQALCQQVGAIVSTSANPSNSSPARTPLQVRGYFADSLDYICPAALGELSGPSEIRHALTGEVIRPGGV